MSHDPNCVFCKIIAGAIPSARVMETPEAIAFLDIGPLNPGHTLVVPRSHHPNLPAMPDDLAGAVGVLLPRVCRAVKSATAAEGLNVLVNTGAIAGQSVEHVHWHIIPRHRDDRIAWPWKPSSYDDADLEAMRSQIAASLAAEST